LPAVLNRQEVISFFQAITFKKHYAIAAVLYSTGIRLSELLNLTIKDIDSQRFLIHIRQGKGAKDRYVPLSKRVLEILRDYYRNEKYKPVTYLFSGKSLNEPLHPRTVQRFISEAKERAGIKKKVSPHVLRHTMATHLLDNGTNIRKIQAVLGHNSLRTTQIYTHLAKDFISSIQNPMDTLFEEKKEGDNE
jgi:integrase/recombinase XerD